MLLSSVKSKFALPVSGLQRRQIPDAFQQAQHYRNPSRPRPNFSNTKAGSGLSPGKSNPARACLIGLAESYCWWGRAFRAF
jgi:hypothetical protein